MVQKGNLLSATRDARVTNQKTKDKLHKRKMERAHKARRCGADGTLKEGGLIHLSPDGPGYTLQEIATMLEIDLLMGRRLDFRRRLACLAMSDGLGKIGTNSMDPRPSQG